MSKLDSEEYQISIEEEIIDPKDHRISIDDKNLPNIRKIGNSIDHKKFLHDGRKVDILDWSPNMEYVVSACFEDSSVYMWKFIKGEREEPGLDKGDPKSGKGEPEIKLDKIFDLEDIYILSTPVRVSDFKSILIGHRTKTSFCLEIRDYTNKSIMILDAQDLQGKIELSGFLKNGELVVVQGYPDRLLILTDVPFVIMQWDLVERNYEHQYELDWNLSGFWDSIWMELNSDCTFLAVAGVLSREKKLKVYFYSKILNALITEQSFNETYIRTMGFIKLKKDEFFLISLGQKGTSYCIGLHDLSNFKNRIESVIFEWHMAAVGELGSPSENDFLIPGHVIRFSKDRFREDRFKIDSLSRKFDFEKFSLQFYLEEIRATIDSYFTEYKNMDQTKNTLEMDEHKAYPGHLYTWIVEYSKRAGMLVARLTARYNKTDEVIGIADVNLHAIKADEICIEFKLHANNDLMLISSSTIQRWRATGIHRIDLINCWSHLDAYFASKTAQQAMIEQLGLLKDKLDSLASNTKKFDRYYEVSVDELTEYVKKLENVVPEETLWSNAIKEIVGYKIKVDERINELDKKFDGKFTEK
ncbi:15260_t:CDS:2 [Acaulospora morrowiae]|uniref:15260_t:CDS:1 n=1 Tax=Acaulospora morrowiae TaxID=94023 RepID=A0A9N9AH55_9GLOM|nr:15260_t:CDS:2 [Acaulospora morrowiae]